MNQNNNNKSNELTKKNKKYNLKNDIIFKAFFARPGNEIFLIDFFRSITKNRKNKNQRGGQLRTAIGRRKRGKARFTSNTK